MKKILFATALLLLSSNFIKAQQITEKDFSSYNNKDLFLEEGKIDYESSAKFLTKAYKANSDNSISRISTINFNGIDKNKIYKDVNDWFSKSFKGDKSEIKLNDKSHYRLIGQGHIEKVAEHTSLTSSSKINGNVLMEVDITDEKVNVKTTILSYEMEMGQGVLGTIGGVSYSIWQPVKSFPYTGKKYKLTASKALVNCHIWSQLMANEMTNYVMKTK